MGEELHEPAYNTTTHPTRHGYTHTHTHTHTPIVPTYQTTHYPQKRQHG